MIRAEENEGFTPDFFLHNNLIFNQQSLSIDEQLSWLTKELKITKH